METVVIKKSSSKVLMALIGSLLFVAVGLWFFLNAAELASDDASTLRIVGIVAMVFFGMTAVFFVRRLFDSRPGLVIDAKGIQDFSSASAIALIAWDDILGFEVQQMRNVKFVVVLLRNPEAYIAAASGMKKTLLSANAQLCGSPATISPTSLACSFDELLFHLNRAREASF